MPVKIRNIRFVMNKTLLTGIKFENFIDIDSGRGKPCIYMANKNYFSKIIGVEYSGELVKIAEKNKNISKFSNIEFLCCNAGTYKLPASKSLIFLFNPFDDSILNEFILNNLRHFCDNETLLIYINDKHDDIIKKVWIFSNFQ